MLVLGYSFPHPTSGMSQIFLDISVVVLSGCGVEFVSSFYKSTRSKGILDPYGYNSIVVCYFGWFGVVGIDF